jgi:uncharacterized protein (TIGR02757 family)
LKEADVKKTLNALVRRYNTTEFIANDPISIPHLFSKKQDIEISGLFAATLAWGQRVTIINNCKRLMNWMDNAPYDFICNHTDADLKPFLNFTHRTFNPTDALYFIDFLKNYYSKNQSLETAFAMHLTPKDTTIENALVGFHDLFFADEDAPQRTRKHVATPRRKSACKRLCMYLRWMVRRDQQGVDFGLWREIKPSQLICPIDVHVERVARAYNFIYRQQVDWQCALELTQTLKTFDALDPVKYDFALFGLSVFKDWQRPV